MAPAIVVRIDWMEPVVLVSDPTDAPIPIPAPNPPRFRPFPLFVSYRTSPSGPRWTALALVPSPFPLLTS